MGKQYHIFHHSARQIFNFNFKQVKINFKLKIITERDTKSHRSLHLTKWLPQAKGLPIMIDMSNSIWSLLLPLSICLSSKSLHELIIIE